MKFKRFAVFPTALLFFSVSMVTATADTLFVSSGGAIKPMYTYDSSGTQTFFADQAGVNARQMTADAAGNIYVTYFTDDTIYKFSPSGVPSLVQTGIVDSPFGLARDNNGNLYVSRVGGSTITRIAPDGSYSLFGNAGGTEAVLAFHNGRLYAAAENGVVSSFDLTTGVASLVANLSVGRKGGLVFDSQGNMFTANHLYLQKVTPDGAVSIVHDFLNDQRGLGFHGIAIDSADNLFVSETSFQTIWKITPDGVMTAFANQASPVFMLVVPEPSLAALLLLGLLAMAFTRRLVRAQSC